MCKNRHVPICTYIADKVLENYILPNGDNLVYGKLGGSVNSIEKIINRLKDNGYNTTLVLNDLPIEKALQRSIGRYKSTGRLVAPQIGHFLLCSAPQYGQNAKSEENILPQEEQVLLVGTPCSSFSSMRCATFDNA